MSARDVPALLFCVWCVWALHQPDARGGAEGGCYCHEYDDGEVDDFLPKFFLYKLKINFFSCHPDDRREEGSCGGHRHIGDAQSEGDNLLHPARR